MKIENQKDQVLELIKSEREKAYWRGFVFGVLSAYIGYFIGLFISL